MEYRIARPADQDFLQRLRHECGWGLEKLTSSITDPNRFICILKKDERDVGMAMWCLEFEDNMASKDLGIVHIGKGCSSAC